MKKLSIIIAAIAALTLAAPASAHWQFPWNRPKPAIGDPSMTPSNPLAQLQQSIQNLLHGTTSLPKFTSDDLANAKAILAHHAAVTQNPDARAYDAAGMNCVDKIVLHLPELQLAATPPVPATPPPPSAPVTGIASGVAFVQVNAEDLSDLATAANAQIAAATALFAKGAPPDIHIACSYLLVERHTLLPAIGQLGAAAQAAAPAVPVK